MITRLLLLTMTLTLAACGAQQTAGQPSSTPPSASASQPSSTDAPTEGLGPFTCSNRSGGVASAFAQLKAIRVASHPAFDRVTFEFAPFADRPSGMPLYELTQQASTRFVKDASGLPVSLTGTAGLKAVFRNSSGQGTYTGSADLKPSTVSITEIAQLGDFERVLTWGVGLNRPACFRTVELTSPTRLAIDFQTQVAH